MSENDLIKQLNTLKNIKPDDAWKIKNREILYRQISDSTVADSEMEISKAGRSFIFAWPVFVLKKISQPALAVVLILLFMLGSGFASVRAAKDSKPGDSLYIAKILSERTQLAFTFNEKEKARLSIEFAGNRAKEIDQVIKESGQNNEDVEKLVDSLKKEIGTIKSRVQRISGKTEENPALAVTTPATEGITGSTTDNVGDETSMFSADIGKEEKGLSISEPEKEDKPAVKEEKAPAAETPSPDITNASTGTPEITASSSSSTPSETITQPAESDTQSILKEAEQSLQSDNYDNTITKLDEAVDAINKVDKGEVKGESDSATATGNETNATSTGEEAPSESATTTSN